MLINISKRSHRFKSYYFHIHVCCGSYNIDRLVSRVVLGGGVRGREREREREIEDRERERQGGEI